MGKLMSSRDAPRYLVLTQPTMVRVNRQGGQYWEQGDEAVTIAFPTLVAALEFAGQVGGLVYEPLAMGTAERVAATGTHHDEGPVRVTGDLTDAAKQPLTDGKAYFVGLEGPMDEGRCDVVGCRKDVQFVVDSNDPDRTMGRRCEDHY